MEGVTSSPQPGADDNAEISENDTSSIVPDIIPLEDYNIKKVSDLVTFIYDDIGSWFNLGSFFVVRTRMSDYNGYRGGSLKIWPPYRWSFVSQNILSTLTLAKFHIGAMWTWNCCDIKYLGFLSFNDRFNYMSENAIYICTLF